MILGTDLLLKMVNDEKLVENLCKRELTNPEGAGFDLRLGEAFGILGTAFLGIDERQTPFTAQCDPVGPILIKPGAFYLVKTVEKINLPVWLAANIKPRTTLFRSGLILSTGPVQPGYSGELTFGLFNAGPCTVRIELGARIAHIQFEPVIGEASPYRGQWQGGRVSTDGIETQV